MEHELKPPPMDIDAERRVLGHLLSTPCSMQRIDRLSSTDFYRDDHRIIFGNIRKIFWRGMRTDPKTIDISIRRGRGQERMCVGRGYLNELAALSGFSDYDVWAVAETARRRRLISGCDHMCVALLTGEMNPRSFVRLAREFMNYYWDFMMVSPPKRPREKA